jgi:hypothetical protein
MHHCLWRQGLSSFFEKRSDGFGRDALDAAQLDGFPGQQAQRPMVVPVEDGAARDGDEVGLLRAGQGLTIPDLTLMTHHGIHPAFRIAGADRHDGIAADIVGATDFGQAPAFAQFEQDLRPGTCAGALMAEWTKVCKRERSVSDSSNRSLAWTSDAASPDAVGDVVAGSISTSFDAY